MERDTEHAVVLVELGAASHETKGPIGPLPDEAFGRVDAGLSND